MTPEEFAITRRQLSDALIGLLTTLFTQPDSWRNQDATDFVTQAVPLVAGAQRSLAAATAVFVADQVSQQLGEAVTAPAIDDSDAVHLREGVAPELVYRRPYATVYTGLAAGQPLAEAVEHGRNRLREVAEMDMQQTYSRASRAAMRGTGRPPRGRGGGGGDVKGWRRVLIGDTNCALCIVASTQRYTVEQLNPTHPVCDCISLPLVSGRDEHVLDPELLNRVHGAVQELTGREDAGARAPDYRKILIDSINNHGELGPLLARPLDKFTGPADIGG